MSSLTEHINPRHYHGLFEYEKPQCIDLTRHMNFDTGNAIKYVWRAGSKEGSDFVEDLDKAEWYLEDAKEFDVREVSDEAWTVFTMLFCDFHDEVAMKKKDIIEEIIVGNYQGAIGLIEELKILMEEKA